MTMIDACRDWQLRAPQWRRRAPRSHPQAGAVCGQVMSPAGHADIGVLHHLLDGRMVFQEPKTARSRRLIALSPAAVLALKSHREKQEADRDLMGRELTAGDLVFAHSDGSPYLPDTVSHAFKKIAGWAGLPRIRLHDLRHAHASLMLRQGVHPKIVQERLGHSTISVTLDTYSHVLPGLQEAAAAAF